MKDKKADDRHASLDKAVKAYGGLAVQQKLNALSVLTKNTHKTISRIFERDRNYVHKKISDTKLNKINRAKKNLVFYSMSTTKKTTEKSKSKSPTIKFTDLPKDVYQEIYNKLSVFDQNNFRNVNKELREYLPEQKFKLGSTPKKISKTWVDILEKMGEQSIRRWINDPQANNTRPPYVSVDLLNKMNEKIGNVVFEWTPNIDNSQRNIRNMTDMLFSVRSITIDKYGTLLIDRGDDYPPSDDIKKFIIELNEDGSKYDLTIIKLDFLTVYIGIHIIFAKSKLIFSPYIQANIVLSPMPKYECIKKMLVDSIPSAEDILQVVKYEKFSNDTNNPDFQNKYPPSPLKIIHPKSATSKSPSSPKRKIVHVSPEKPKATTKSRKK